MEAAAAPRGILNADMRTLNPKQLDRFDYFFAALKKNGIYSDINLQVTRKYPGLLPPDSQGQKSAKGIDLFQPNLIQHQKEYAKNLLLHRNPYTGNRYVDEPAVVLVEINNENGLLKEWQAGHLDHINLTYKQTLRSQWEDWLSKRYASKRERLSVWTGNWITDANILAINKETNGWQLQLGNGASGSLQPIADKKLTIDITHQGIQDWDAQIHWPNIALYAKKRYKLSLKLRANTHSRITIYVGQNHFPWKNLWHQSVDVSNDWKTLESEFSIPVDEAQARLTITGLGLIKQKLDVADVKLSSLILTNKITPIAANLDTLKLPTIQSFKSLDINIRQDWMQFLWDTELAYWTDMQSYLRNSLGVKSLLIGTQALSYSPAAIQASLDVIDVHGYWDHPVYPHKPFDMHDWTMQNDFLAGNANPSTVTDLAMFRVFGKPFVVTEYDHPFPTLYEAEGLPLISAYGAFQDWDGVFQYCYGLHSGDWKYDQVSHFFDSHANPVKMIGILASALLFRREDVKASLIANQQPILPFDNKASTWIPTMLAYNRVPSAGEFGLSRNLALYQAVGFNSALNDSSTGAGLGSRVIDTLISRLMIKTHAVTSDTGELTWNHPNSVVTIDTPRSKGIIGAPWSSIQLGEWKFELLNAPTERGVLLTHVMEGNDFKNASKVLVIAMSEIKNASKNVVNKSKLNDPWGGSGSTQLALTPVRLELPTLPRRVHAWALDPRGNRMTPIAIQGTERAIITLDKKTLWYEIQIDSPT
jgi:hypothetical protein